MIDYFANISTLSSQAVNVIFLFGNPDETVCARCYRLRDRKGWGMAYRTFNRIFFWQANHCKESFDADIKYAEEVQRYVDNNR